MLLAKSIRKGFLIIFIKKDENIGKIDNFHRKFKRKIKYYHEGREYCIFILRGKPSISQYTTISETIPGYFIKLRRDESFLKVLRKFFLSMIYKNWNISLDENLISDCRIISLFIKYRRVIIDLHEKLLFIQKTIMEDINNILIEHGLDIKLLLKYLKRKYFPYEKKRLFNNITYDYIKLSKRICMLESTIRRERKNGAVKIIHIADKGTEKKQRSLLLRDIKTKFLPIFILGILYYPMDTEYHFHIYFSNRSYPNLLIDLKEELIEEIDRKYSFWRTTFQQLKIDLEIHVKMLSQ